MSQAKKATAVNPVIDSILTGLRSSWDSAPVQQAMPQLQQTVKRIQVLQIVLVVRKLNLDLCFLPFV